MKIKKVRAEIGIKNLGLTFADPESFMDDDVWNEDEPSNQTSSKDTFEKDLEKLQQIHSNASPCHYVINV
jgi:hypothetical protein